MPELDPTRDEGGLATNTPEDFSVYDPALEEMAVRPLGELLQRPAVIQHQMHILAHTITRAFAEHTPGAYAVKDFDIVHDITPERWKEHIDTTQPTIGVRYYMHALLGSAAAQLRARGESICNVVFLPDVATSDEAYDDTTYVANRGVFLDAQGKAYAGNFPEPLRIDVLQPYDHTKKLPVRSLNEPAHEAVFNDKALTQTALEGTGITFPKPILQNITKDDDRLFALIEKSLFTSQSQAIVIKPTQGHTGDNVIMVEKYTTLEDEVWDQLGRIPEDETLVVQPWIRSYPLHHAESGARLDWNIRALLVNDKTIGSYVRADVFGKPINIGKEAHARSLAETLHDCGLSEQQQQLVRARLQELYRKITEALPGTIKGLDIIIDEQLEPVIIEVNGQDSGGLSNSMLVARRDAQNANVPGEQIADIVWEPAFQHIRELHAALFKHYVVLETPAPTDPHSLITSEDILSGLLHADSRDPEAVLEVMQTAHDHLQENAHLITPELQNLANYATKHLHYALAAANNTISSHVENDPEFGLQEGARLLRSGQTEEGFLAIANFVKTTQDIRQRERAIEYFMQTVAENKDGQGYAIKAFTLRSSWGIAELLAKAAIHDLFTDLGLNQNALSLEASRQLCDIYTDFFATDVDVRSVPSPEEILLTPGEKSYLKHFFPYTAGMEAFAKGDWQTLHGLLRQNIQTECKDNAYQNALPYELYNYLIKTNTSHKPEHAETHALCLVAVRCLPEAYIAAYGQPKKIQQQLFADLRNVCATDLTKDDIDPASPAGQQLTSALFTTLEALRKGEYEPTSDALAFERELENYDQPELLEDIRHRILDYVAAIEDAANNLAG